MYLNQPQRAFILAPPILTLWTLIDQEDTEEISFLDTHSLFPNVDTKTIYSAYIPQSLQTNGTRKALKFPFFHHHNETPSFV